MLWSKKEKEFEKIKNNPKNIKFTTIDKLLRQYGFTVRQPKGGSSHYIYKKDKLTLTIPKHSPVREVYIKKAFQFIEEVLKNE